MESCQPTGVQRPPSKRMSGVRVVGDGCREKFWTSNVKKNNVIIGAEPGKRIGGSVRIRMRKVVLGKGGS